MFFGVHTSVRKGFAGALKDAHDLGCTAFQMFTQSPRGWRTRVYADQEFEQFRSEQSSIKMGPVVVHSPYLPNLCTSDSDLYNKSLETLKADLKRCEKLGSPYLVIHPGAYSPEKDYETGLAQITKAFNETLGEIPGSAMICIENMAGGGRRLGGSFSQIKDMINGVKEKKRMGVCFDTCHAYAAGYDISTKKGVDATLNEFEKDLGLDLIKVFHVNDSKGECRSHRDRHEHLGKGKVGLTGLKALLGQPQFKDRIFILETPKETPASDPENLKRLKHCLKLDY